MLKTDQMADRLLHSNSCRPLIAMIKLLKFDPEEEMVANALKIVRYCIKEEQVSFLRLMIN